MWTEQDGWEDAPFVPDAFTINTGDLLARWSGDRWKSNRHRVLPPQADAPDEDLVSLVYFYEADRDAVIEALQPPDRQAEHLPAGGVVGLPPRAPGRDHRRLITAEFRPPDTTISPDYWYLGAP